MPSRSREAVPCINIPTPRAAAGEAVHEPRHRWAAVFAFLLPLMDGVVVLLRGAIVNRTKNGKIYRFLYYGGP